MKSFVVLASFLLLGVVVVVVSADSDIAVKKYLHAVPEPVLAKCLKESGLEADKDKLLSDESTVDQGKFSCLIACTLKDNGALVNGELKYDVLSELLSKLLTNKEDKLQERLELLKACIPEGANAKNDCEYIGKIMQCKLSKAKEMGL
ncbi:PREDICTED: uncharacterized protein LOC107069709 [Polistes dominula]|uniref:Uncharacterized protein LOC107069709 n=2 Tax=Polistes dominula TaxID=743375 RepID=A0ABM1IR80_POLDO|nr:PREDICTED: uncharacterized protein LOC107069709 [Polistes dominula]